jgi:hypothetical protein
MKRLKRLAEDGGLQSCFSGIMAEGTFFDSGSPSKKKPAVIFFP